MIDKQIPKDFYRIKYLFSDLSTAARKRMKSEEGPIDARLQALQDDVYPWCPEEIAVWTELTSPENREALLQYVACYRDVKIHDHAKRLFAALIAESDRRATK